MAELKDWGWPPNKAAYQVSWMQGHRMNNQLFEQLWSRQAGRCPGCLGAFAHPLKNANLQGLEPRVDRRPLEPKDPKDIRGLICSDCRSVLKELLKDKERKQRLIDYLRQAGDWHA